MLLLLRQAATHLQLVWLDKSLSHALDDNLEEKPRKLRNKAIFLVKTGIKVLA